MAGKHNLMGASPLGWIQILVHLGRREQDRCDGKTAPFDRRRRVVGIALRLSNWAKREKSRLSGSELFLFLIVRGTTAALTRQSTDRLNIVSRNLGEPHETPFNSRFSADILQRRLGFSEQWDLKALSFVDCEQCNIKSVLFCLS
jgi:hypothetical protein